MAELFHNEAGGGEYACSDHIGNDQDSRREETDLSSELAITKAILQCLL